MSSQNNNGDLGKQIQETVNDAIKTGDFSRLNADITSTVLSVLNGVGDQINAAVSEARSSAQQSGRAYYDSVRGERGFTQGRPVSYSDRDVERHQKEREALVRRPQNSNRVKFNDVGVVSGYFGVFGGAWLTLVGLIAALEAPLPIAGVVISVLGLLLVGKGSNNIKWHNLAKRYKKLCSEKLYIGIDAIANATGTSQKKVIRNVKKILAKGFFPEGYIDEGNTTFMVSKEVYDQYIETKLHAVERLAQQDKEEQERAMDAAAAKMNAMISSGMAFIDKIHQLNAQIPGEVISEKLSRLEGLLIEIFNRVKEHPEQTDNCGKLMDYYLPMIIKLVEAYADYDKVSSPGPDIISAKRDIENTLDITNQAFTELLNKLFMNSVWDVKSDAKVLKTMLRQEGLAEDGLAKKSDEITDFGVGYVEGDEDDDDTFSVPKADKVTQVSGGNN